jgi:hypothetical protein
MAGFPIINHIDFPEVKRFFDKKRILRLYEHADLPLLKTLFGPYFAFTTGKGDIKWLINNGPG